jgi:hypothetical protein
MIAKLAFLKGNLLEVRDGRFPVNTRRVCSVFETLAIIYTFLKPGLGSLKLLTLAVCESVINLVSCEIMILKVGIYIGLI